MYEGGLCEGHVGGFLQVDAFAGQGLDDAPVVQLTVVGVGVDVRQGQAVQLGVGQRVHYARFQILLILCQYNKCQLHVSYTSVTSTLCI